MPVQTSNHPTALIFGAGSVGRGFLGQLFSESGYDLVFADVDDELVQALNERKGYTLRLAGVEKSQDLNIGPLRAINARNADKLVAEISEASIIATAVGARALLAISKPIAAGLEKRWKDASAEAARPLNIIICENLHDAPELLQGYINDNLSTYLKPLLKERVGFVPAVIARMSPVPTQEQRALDITLIVAEPYKVLPVNRDAFVGEIPQIVGMKAVSPFAAYTERKLYIHNTSHAILGYLGHQKGYTYGYEALEDPWIRTRVEKALDEASRALIAEHKFEPVAFQEHVDYLLIRFKNKALSDPVDRLARDVIRKLSPTDRLVGVARLAEKHSIVPESIALGIAAAFAYKNPSDPHSNELQAMLENEGFEKVLQNLCKIDPNERLGVLVKKYLHNKQG